MFSDQLHLYAPVGFYPEKKACQRNWFEALCHSWASPFANRLAGRVGRFEEIIVAAEQYGIEYIKWDAPRLAEEARQLRPVVRKNGLTLKAAARVYALVREQAGRLLGIRHHDVQMIGGWILLNGMVAEMETGEGKTLTATLPACAAVLAGMPVHIITVNDYLAARDAELMMPLYTAMGVSVGVIQHGMDPAARRRAYRCDVVYGSNKEIVFDYLKDHLTLPQRPGHIAYPLQRLYGTSQKLDNLLLRGLTFAIIDEADSVLVDEARTPLVISGPGDASLDEQVYAKALELARGLLSGTDFIVQSGEKNVRLTEAGRGHLKNLAPGAGPFFSSRAQREEIVHQALAALYLYRRDEEYLVVDNTVQIVDEYTGRLMADRSWERGLQQLVECKEGCPVTARRETLARISYQRFFRRYHRLAGMTGTAQEVKRELWEVYDLRVVRVPTNQPLVRKGWGDRFFPSEKEKFQFLVSQVRELREEGRPVLIGTPTVAVSERLGRVLGQNGLDHKVLNARQDQEEAAIIALAGQAGRITVATNMAGRGTDIRLGNGVRERRGLHVIATEPHSAGRIDRQLFGRCGRQGEPGTFQRLISLDDGILAAKAIVPMVMFLRFLAKQGVPTKFACFFLPRLAQRIQEKKHHIIRRRLQQLDESTERALAFSGHRE